MKHSNCLKFRDAILVILRDLAVGKFGQKICSIVATELVSENTRLSDAQREEYKYLQSKLRINGFMNPLDFKKLRNTHLSETILLAFRKRNDIFSSIIKYWIEMDRDLDKGFLETNIDKLKAFQIVLEKEVQADTIKSVANELYQLVNNFVEQCSEGDAETDKEKIARCVFVGADLIITSKIECVQAEQENTPHASLDTVSGTMILQPVNEQDFSSQLSVEIMKMIMEESPESGFWDESFKLSCMINKLAEDKKNQRASVRKGCLIKEISDTLEELLNAFSEEMISIEMESICMPNLDRFDVLNLEKLQSDLAIIFDGLTDYKSLYANKPALAERKTWYAKISDTEVMLSSRWKEFTAELLQRPAESTATIITASAVDTTEPIEVKDDIDKEKRVEHKTEAESSGPIDEIGQDNKKEDENNKEEHVQDKAYTNLDFQGSENNSATEAEGDIQATDEVSQEPVDWRLIAIEKMSQMCMTPRYFPELWLILSSIMSEKTVQKELHYFPTRFMLEIGHIVLRNYTSPIERQLNNPRLQNILTNNQQQIFSSMENLSSAQWLGCFALSLPIHFLHGLESPLVDYWMSPGNRVPAKLNGIVDAFRQLKGQCDVSLTSKYAQLSQRNAEQNHRNELREKITEHFRRNAQLAQAGKKTVLWDRMFPYYGESELLQWLLNDINNSEDTLPVGFLERVEQMEETIADDAAKRILGKELTSYARRQVIKEINELQEYAKLWSQTFGDELDGQDVQQWRKISQTVKDCNVEWEGIASALPSEFNLLSRWTCLSFDLLTSVAEKE